MKSSEVLELIRAGYTRDEIEAMDAQEQAPAQDQGQQQAPSAQPDASAQILAALQAIANQKPAPAPAPVTPAQPTQAAPQPAPAPAPAPQPSNEDNAARILASLGALAQGVTLPKPELTIEEKLANTLALALGVNEDRKEPTNGI